jgi:hypothetical protein
VPTHLATLLLGWWGPLLLFLSLLPSLPGCASADLRYAKIDRALQSGNPDEGVAIVEQSRAAYGKQSDALYLMDKGMLLHLAGRYTESTEALSKAEELTEEFYTKRILSEVAAFMTTDNTLPYEGEDFEKVLLNLVMALDYVHLGQWDDALVEARKVDHKLNVLAQRNNRKMAYSKDGFARYLSGVLYEASGDLTNAFVAYRLAYDAFQQSRKEYGTNVPDLLRQDLLRLSDALGLRPEHDEYRQLFDGIEWRSETADRGLGEIVFITYAGHAPVKRDVFVDVPIGVDAIGVVLATKGLHRQDMGNHRAAESVLYGLTGRVVRLAVPQFVPRRSGVAYTEATAVSGDTHHSARSVVMEDITAIAMRDLEDRLLRTTTKAVARAAWKYALAEGVGVGVRQAFSKKEQGVVAGAVASAIARVFAVASEEADKRSWATLPDRIHVGRVRLPPGTYDVEFRHIGGYGTVVERQTVQGVRVAEGQKRFLSTRVLQ